MGVYIKGMEMPTRCEDCFCYRHNAEYDYAYCNISSVNVRGHGNARLNSCPLVPVPPHGRLVKASKVEFELCESTMPQKYRDFCRRVINDENLVPTIIPAEEEN